METQQTGFMEEIIGTPKDYTASTTDMCSTLVSHQTQLAKASYAREGALDQMLKDARRREDAAIAREAEYRDRQQALLSAFQQDAAERK